MNLKNQPVTVFKKINYKIAKSYSTFFENNKIKVLFFF